jgi:hypothetical protein
MKLYPIYPSLVDVFSGDGWYNWSRWKCIKKTWIQIQGNKVEHPALIIKTLYEGNKNEIV